MPSRAELQPDMSTLTPVVRSTPQSAPALPDATPRSNPNIRTTLAPIQQMQPDQQRQFFKVGLPQTRISPMGTTAQPSINASANGIASAHVDPLAAQTAANTTSIATVQANASTIPAWNASVTWYPGQQVLYNLTGPGSITWLCLAVNKGSAPNQASTVWQIVGTSSTPFSADGVPIQDSNLVANGNFQNQTAPTGIQSATASAIRVTDPGGPSPNGWTRSFETRAGSSEGQIYAIPTVAGAGLIGPYMLILNGVGVADRDFAAVSDAFPVKQAVVYTFSAAINAGYGATFPTNAEWKHSVFFYAVGATDFSRTSASLIGSFNDITPLSTVAGASVSQGNLTAPAGAGYCRIAFYHWRAASAPTLDWNLAVSGVSCIPAVDPSSINMLAKGSTPSSLTTGFTYSSTTTSVTISWSGLTVYRADGTTTAIANGSQLVTGLSASTSYKVYPYFDENLGTLNFVTGGVGSPAICMTAGSNAVSQSQNLQSRVPLSTSSGFVVATPASGSGAGAGGGSGSSLKESMLVETSRGITPIIETEIGDQVRSEHGWETITGKKVGPAEIFLCIELTDGSEVVCTPTHPFTLPAGSDCTMKRAQDLSMSDFLITNRGVGTIKRIEVVGMKARKVSLTTGGPSHAFFAGRVAPTILTHNFLPS